MYPTACPDCHADVNRTINICPQCGYPIRQLFIKNEQDAETAFRNAQTNLLSKNFKLAEIFIKQALDLFPENDHFIELNNKIKLLNKQQLQSEELFIKAKKFFEEEEFEKSEKNIDIAIQLDHDKKYHDFKNIIQEKRAQRDKGVELFEKATTLYNHNEFDTAFKVVNQALTILPGNKKISEFQGILKSALAESKYNFACSLVDQKKWILARSAMNDCLSLASDDKKYQSFKTQIDFTIRKRKRNKILAIAVPSIIAIIAMAFLFIFFYTRILDDKAWKIAHELNTVESYTEYLNIRTNGDYLLKASAAIHNIKKYEQNMWINAQSSNTIVGYRLFLSKFPNSMFAMECNDKLELLNIQKRAGEFYYEDERGIEPGYELEVQTDFSCFIRNSAGNSIICKGKVVDDNFFIFIPNGAFFSANNNSKPALILSYSNSILYSEMPQSYNETDRSPHAFFKRKPSDFVTTFERSNIQLLANKYYTAVVNREYVTVSNFFIPIVKRYYSKRDVTKDQIIQFQKEYWTDSEIYSAKFEINYGSIKFFKDKNENILVRFTMDYELNRADKKKFNKFKLYVDITFNKDFLIESINDNTLSRQRIVQ